LGLDASGICHRHYQAARFRCVNDEDWNLEQQQIGMTRSELSPTPNAPSSSHFDSRPSPYRRPSPGKSKFAPPPTTPNVCGEEKGKRLMLMLGLLQFMSFIFLLSKQQEKNCWVSFFMSLNEMNMIK